MRSKAILSRQICRSGALVAALAAAALVAACSSGGSASQASSPVSGSGSASSSPADTGSSAASSASGYLTPPAALPVNEPVSKTIPNGAKIVFLAQPYSQSQSLAAGLQQASHVLGWSVRVVTYDPASPPTFTTALTSAISQKPTAIVITGALDQQFATQLSAARAAHIALIPAITPQMTQQPGLYPVLNSNSELGYQAKMITDTVLADAAKNGKTAHILQIAVPQVSAYLSVEDAVAKSEVSAKCSQCTRDLIDVTLANLFNGTYAQQVVSYLQSHPEINYVISDSGQAGDGLGAAIQQAGITNVKLYGIAATNIQLGQLKSGQAGAWSVQPFQEDGWIIADQIARVLVGDPTNLWDSEHMAYVVTSSNVPSVADPDDVAIPADYQAQFEKMWGK